MKLLSIIKDKFLLEHLEIAEIALDSTNGLDLAWVNDYQAEFDLDGIAYQVNFDELPTPMKLFRSDSDYIYKGKLFNVGFGEKGDDPFALSSSLPKAGKANVVKIYTTMFKAIEEFVSKQSPDYLLLSSYKASGYFPIYNNLTKTNKIVGYQRKMVDSWELDGQSIQSIVLKRINK